MLKQVNAWLVVCIGLGVGSVNGQGLTYPGCSALTPENFSFTSLAKDKGLQEPVAFDLQGVRNPAGDSVLQVNIFFVERKGKVKFYDGATKAVTLAGTIPVLATSQQCCGGADDNGLMGIAVDPKYSVNRWIYVWYSPQTAAAVNPRLRLSRFTVSAQNTLDMATEKILIDILTSKGEHRHAGGPMTFDGHGDLWVTLGQSGNDINYPTSGSQWSATDSGLNQEWGPSNTASLRGGIFRIHPDENATSQRIVGSGTYGPGYTIPAGNFGEYWAGQFTGQGKPDLAMQYRDPAKVLPEVYIKGNRSPHSIGVHPTKHWLTWGEVNPPNNADEINLVANPVFGGMPYFYGNNTVVAYPGAAKSAAAPTNTSAMNSGVSELPPAMPGTMVCCTNMGNVAMAGPFYVYDRSLKSKDKLPPHFDNRFFHFSFQDNRLWVNTVDTTTAQITRTDRLDNNLMQAPLASALASRIGPDGALYILNYDGYYTTIKPDVLRIGYSGSCVLSHIPVSKLARATDPGIHWTPQGLVVEVRHEFSLHDLKGRRLLRLSGEGREVYSPRELRARYRLQGGLALLAIRTDGGTYSEKVVY